MSFNNLRVPLLSSQPNTIEIPRKPSKLPSVITYEEYEGFREVTADHTNLPASIIDKLNYAKKYYKQQPSHGYSIQKEEFDTVYSTSDIHSDVYTFIKILNRLGLLKQTESLVKQKQNDLISIQEIFLIEWNATVRNTLLVIVGDLVDGAKSSSKRLDGDAEILLHILIYNLRISARKYNSEIRFTIGNHDFHTVIQKKEISFPQNETIYGPSTINDDLTLSPYVTNLEFFYDENVAKPVKDFFNVPGETYVYKTNKENRRNCLILFYECSPYIFLEIEKEVIFIHASLHSKAYDKPVDLTQTLNEIQVRIDDSEDFGELLGTNDYSQFLGIVSDKQKKFGSPLWSRVYAYSTEQETCPLIEKSPYNLIVVGHCPTDIEEQGSLLQKLLNERNADKCRTRGGCVLLGCENKIAFVDISMSFTENNKMGKNRGEVLKLTKNSNNNFIPSIVSEKLGAIKGNTPPNSYPGYNQTNEEEEDEDDGKIKVPPPPNGNNPGVASLKELEEYNLDGGKRKSKRKKTLKKKRKLIHRKKYSFKKTFLK
jgi:hypothetical protein